MNERLIEVFRNTFKLKEVNEDISQLNCPVWDSLNHLNLIIEIEEEFDVSFEPEEIAIMKSFVIIENLLTAKT